MNDSKIILYLGNKLQKHGKNPTGVEFLGRLLKERFEVISASDKLNQFLRALDMLRVFWGIRNKVDYVFIDTYSTLNIYYAWVFAKLSQYFEIPYIPLLRGGDLPSRLDKSTKLCGSIFSHSLMNVAPSTYLVEEFEKRGYSVQHIPNTFELHKYDFKERDVFAPRLLYVRAFQRIYNPLMAAEVLANLVKDYPMAELCMVGPDKDGSMHEFKQRIQEFGLENNVKITGRLPKEEWLDLAKDYDIFINTTDFDNTPMSVMEAMALGLVVVSTNAGGLPYLIENNVDGLLVPVGDSKGMVQAICGVINDPFFSKKMVLQAFEKVSSFDWNVVKHSWFDLLEK